MSGRHVALAALAAAASLPVAGAGAKAAGAGLYVAMGDSIAAGYGASSQARSYVGLYYGFLRTSGTGVETLRNVSGGGASSRDLLETQVPAATTFVNDSSDTKVVTIAIGLRDEWYGCDEPGGQRCRLGPNLRAAMAAVDQALRGDSGDEIVQVLEYPTIEGADDVNRLLVGADRRIDCSATGADVGLNDIIRCTALEAGAVPIAVRQLEQDELAADGHPNDAGHRTIAEAFGGAVELAPDPAPAARCIVPRVTGKRLAAARRAITRAGCTTGKVTRRYARAPLGTVVRQSPAPSRRLPRGARVSLVVSRGLAP